VAPNNAAMSEDEIARRAQEAFAENLVQGFLIALAAQPGSITVIDPVDVPVEGRREADVITFDLPDGRTFEVHVGARGNFEAYWDGQLVARVAED
jgi:hypothetical protein